MGDSYEAWTECKRRLAKEPDSVFLQRVESSLRQDALEDYLESFRGLDGSEEPLTVDEHEAVMFLAGLDELRAPSDAELRTARELALRDAAARIKDLLKLNWTGDHLYSDAVEDALTMLTSVAEGKPVPKLERFRCPSKALDRGAVVRCEYQLPHEGPHKVTDPLLKWTDVESMNPPVPYDSDAEELSGHPVRKVDRLSAPICGAFRQTAGLTLRCDLPAGHTGDHQDDGSMGRWS